MRTAAALLFVFSIVIAGVGCSGDRSKSARLEPVPPAFVADALRSGSEDPGLDSLGDAKWSIRLGTAGFQAPHAIVAEDVTDSAVCSPYPSPCHFVWVAGELNAPDAKVYLAKIRSDDDGGQVLWTGTFGSVGGQQRARAIAVDSSGNVYLAGEFQGVINFGSPEGDLHSLGYDAFVVKFSPSGSALVAKRFGLDDDQRANSIAIDRENNVLITGDFRNQIDFGGSFLLISHPGYDVFVAKLSTTLDTVWAYGLGSTDDQYGRAIAADDDNNVVIAGTFNNAIDFSPVGGPIFSGVPGHGRVFLAKLDRSGIYQWGNTYGLTGDQYTFSATTDHNQNMIVAGDFTGSVNFGGQTLIANGLNVFVAKFSPAGAHLWSKRFGDGADVHTRSVAVDPSNNVLLAGWFFNGSVSFGGDTLSNPRTTDDLYIAKLNPLAGHLWSRQFGFGTGAFGYRLGDAVTTTSSGNMLLTGHFQNQISIGPGMPLTAQGSYDILVAKFEGSCDATSCADGCCQAGVCNRNPPFPTCGNAGSSCVTCDSTRANHCSSSGACQCGANPACGLGQRCDGTSCVAFCDSSNCPSGCCQGTTCVSPPTGTSCGTSGRACVNCGVGADNCSVTGTCRCGTGSSCPIGQRCNSGQCIPFCDSSYCAGCCQGTSCVSPPTVSDCGSGGQSCSSCDLARADTCSTTGQCRCGTGPACGPTQHCVSGTCGPFCDATNCDGCCDGVTCQGGTQFWQCGIHGSACQACQYPDTCTGGQCGPGQCPPGCGDWPTCSCPCCDSCGCHPCTDLCPL